MRRFAVLLAALSLGACQQRATVAPLSPDESRLMAAEVDALVNPVEVYGFCDPKNDEQKLQDAYKEAMKRPVPFVHLLGTFCLNNEPLLLPVGNRLTVYGGTIRYQRDATK